MQNQDFDTQTAPDPIEELASLADGQADEGQGQGLIINPNKAMLMRKLLANIKESSDQLLKLLDNGPVDLEHMSGLAAPLRVAAQPVEEGEVVEGIFNGQGMVGPDGHEYHISANYASKSKLVEGDLLKLNIAKDGTFIYKQIGPVERERLVGQLRRNGDNDFVAVVGSRTWQLLNASITYFKGDDGDEVVILVPKQGESRWAAVENIIKQ